MSATLPVPSRAAITALRGLVLGTSCTLALVAEDRRRKINNALDVIETSKKLKSSRQYHGGGAQFALALEEDADTLPFPYEPTSRATANSRRRRTEMRRTEFISRSNDVARAYVAVHDISAAPQSLQEVRTARLDSENTPREKPTPFIRPVIVPPTPTPPTHGLRVADATSHEFPSNDHIIAKIHESCESRNEGAMNAVFQLVLAVYQGRSSPETQQRRWTQATGLLCRTLQSLGRVEDATMLLEKVVLGGTVDEADYFAHFPLELVDVHLAGDFPVAAEERKAYASKLDLAITLFLPTFVAKPLSANADAVAIGRKLLDHAFATERLKYVEPLYRRCLEYEGSDGWQLAETFITQLHGSHNYQLAIKHFLQSYTKLSPPTESIQRVGNLIVEAVETAHNHKVAQVLKALVPLCSGTCQLRSQWPMKLLSSHWQKHHDYRETLALFSSLMDSGLKELVPHPDCLDRIMIEIALEAEEESEAEASFRRLISEMPRVATDVRILGRFALFKARKGDWEGVRKEFETMRVDDKRAREYYGSVFVPILKVFAQEHTVSETDAFLRLFIEQLNVPISRHMVALVANKYGSQRDLASFLHWLEYCAGLGFQIDNAFANSILSNCKRRWGFSFSDLRRLFFNLKTWSPGCVDTATERIMVDAAVADGGGSAARGRVVSLGVDPIKVARRGQCASEREVVLAMKEALTCERPARALRIYKRALHLGTPFSPHALRLAVQASLAVNRDDFRPTLALLQDAKKNGNDLGGAIVCILAAHLKKIATESNQPGRSSRRQVLADIESTIGQFGSEGIALDEGVLHKTAALCSHARLYHGTVSYAIRAAEAGGRPGPCYTLTSFRLLLEGYAQLIDIDGMRRVVAQGLSSHYREQPACIRQLKLARAILHSKLPYTNLKRGDILEGLEILDQAIEQAKTFRNELSLERENLEAGVMRIMKQAALNADASLELTKMVWRERPSRIISENANDESRTIAEPEEEERGSRDMLLRDHGAKAADSLDTDRCSPSPAEKRHYELKLRARKATASSPPFGVGGAQNDDPLAVMLEKANLEEMARSAKKASAAGW
ncbi:hypothetical protein GQ53DRAFT_825239 [Thozetella sp. PMI_491]|nr:hypothetical protein GQ53DRAFT_825239 [Thozetella sp. PMI_491]